MTSKRATSPIEDTSGPRGHAARRSVPGSIAGPPGRESPASEHVGGARQVMRPNLRAGLTDTRGTMTFPGSSGDPYHVRKPEPRCRTHIRRQPSARSSSSSNKPRKGGRRACYWRVHCDGGRQSGRVARGCSRCGTLPLRGRTGFDPDSPALRARRSDRCEAADDGGSPP